MVSQLSVTFTGLRFENPFLIASAPPTESDGNIMRAFDAGWGGVVTKTIGLHPVDNVAGPKTKFLRASVDSPRLSMQKLPGTALHSSWNWELISDKTLDWWVPRIHRIKAPTMIVWGEKDGLIPPAYGPLFQRSIRNAQLVTIPDAGHVPMVEQPEAFVQAVTAFPG